MQKMKYTKTFVAEDGEEFPYSEKIDEGGYAYWISVVIDSRNAELFICNWGAHIEFDDDRSWLDFSIAPELMFPGRNRLGTGELLQYMDHILDHFSEGRTYTKEQVASIYQRYLKEKEEKRQQGQ